MINHHPWEQALHSDEGDGTTSADIPADKGPKLQELVGLENGVERRQQLWKSATSECSVNGRSKPTKPADPNPLPSTFKPLPAAPSTPHEFHIN